jgi:hypothetical protein
MSTHHPWTRAIIASAICLFFSACSPNSTETPHSSLPVPQIQEGLPDDLFQSTEKRRLAIESSTRGWTIPEIQSVILVPRLWNPGETITVAFKGGSQDLRDKIANAARLWETTANIHFDFGNAQAGGTLREWTESDTDFTANVRIAFNSGTQGGYWSAIGQESIDRSMRTPDKPSMNFEAFDRKLPGDWQSIVVHEFGHVLGFEHEHQGPFSTCEQEYRWDDEAGYLPTIDPSSNAFIADPQGRHPGIYRVMGGPPNYWQRSRIDFNLRKFAYSSDLESSAFDKLSIMKYRFDQWMYVNPTVSMASGCYSPQTTNISAQDKQTALARYPRRAGNAKQVLDARLSLAHRLLSQRNLAPEIKDTFTAVTKSLSQKRNMY